MDENFNKKVYVITNKSWKDYKNVRAKLQSAGYSVVNLQSNNICLLPIASHVLPLPDWHMKANSRYEFESAASMGKLFLSRMNIANRNITS